jgi:homoserine dehydrogenase
MNSQKINIGLIGFGTVGQGLWEIIQKSPQLPFAIKHICVRQKKLLRNISDSIFDYDVENFFAHPDIDIIVELSNDSALALKAAKFCLEKKIPFVTANKKMLAENLAELSQLQEKFTTPFLYEASVCASIPIIRNLEEYYDNDLLESIGGIVNGSTNYILNRLESELLSFNDALKSAQEAGFAESNPKLDVEGYDSAYKLTLLIYHAFGYIVQPQEILRVGIEDIETSDIVFANEKGLRIRLLAKAYKTSDNKIAAFVLPHFVNSENNYFHVQKAYNGIQTTTYHSETQFFKGKGAGSLATASAVIADLSALTYQYKYAYKKKQYPSTTILDGSEKLLVRIRYPRHKTHCFTSHFHEIKEQFTSNKIAYLIGYMSIDEIIHLREQLPFKFGIIAYE